MDNLTSSQIMWLAIIAGGAFLYPLLMRALSELVAPSRNRMAELGRELLSSPHVTEQGKNIIDGQLDDAFDWRVMIYLSILIPAYTALMVGCRFSSRLSDLEHNVARTAVMAMSSRDPDTHDLLEEFQTCHTRATAAANPLFTVIVAIEFALLAFCMMLFAKPNRAEWVRREASMKAEHWLRHSRHSALGTQG